ncbi:2-hydroxyacid dehydrogenase [Agrobacterium radiobacter]|uniref:Dehydrogenase n=1 Tax=Agrobacterium tumefaciens str. B6 TaxID=1183423 RepID=A0A822VBW7_AGRTU|nr:2-hydroxyacid dehydrogenase [Agrobacterium tumefaciens]KWT85447.1 dehydrogenase [Agrobacterium tumefaciens str. B6]MQB28307.1 2-hydroxyacid dehydrogenase [Agrobacterium tumefaciens]NTA07936.1 2-hydroxyacid dehydrogenase [Agrobacterium tumefaciens]NTA94332.1 2-hydroxyacid dehydrogenase [Agrobacterium tumefaciens]NTB15540.1 2-hydroxyacid dehydrogenase [Agrobacterium tumefaciens]
MSDKKAVVLVPGKINPRVLERLEGKVEILTVPAGAEPVLPEGAAERINAIAVSGVVNAKWIDALPKLEIIANFGVGYDGVDAKHAATRGIVVTNTPDVLNDEVADTTIALLINTVRRLYQAETWLRDGKWVGEGPFALSPFSLRGRKVGLFGMGRIGQEIAKRLEPFKVEIGYHTRSKRDGLSYTYYGSLKEMAKAVDILICIVPGTPETHKAINAEILTALGPEGVFINVGRGSSVDEDALLEALKSGALGAAGLDVFYAEPKVPEAFLSLPNVSLLPHVASASVPTRNAMADLVADNILGWFKDGTVLTPVPETPVKG